MSIRWGIIGCGDVTEVKSGPGFQKAACSRLVAVMRRDSERCADYARRHGVPKWTTDAEALIRDPEVDAVYIATPPGSHLEYALRVAAAGKPAYVEKPMARNHAECQRLVAAFAQARMPLFVAYYRRALPRFVRARELIREGRLGTVTGVTYRYAAPALPRERPPRVEWRVQAESAGGGIFLDLGSHTLDALDFMLGPIAEVAGTAANLAAPYDVEDGVVMHVRFACGALGIAAWNFAAGTRDDTIEIHGTGGRLTLSTFGDEPLALAGPGGTETFSLPNPPHIQQPLIQTLVDQLSGHGECPSTGVSAARTAWVMDRALESYYGGRDDAFWTRPQTWPGRRPG